MKYILTIAMGCLIYSVNAQQVIGARVGHRPADSAVINGHLLYWYGWGHEDLWEMVKINEGLSRRLDSLTGAIRSMDSVITAKTPKSGWDFPPTLDTNSLLNPIYWKVIKSKSSREMPAPALTELPSYGRLFDHLVPPDQLNDPICKPTPSDSAYDLILQSALRLPPFDNSGNSPNRSTVRRRTLVHPSTQ